MDLNQDVTDRRQEIRFFKLTLSQSMLTSVMITIIVMLTFILSLMANDKNFIIAYFVYFCPVITLFIGGYAFTYKGKKYRSSRLLFYTLFSLSVVILAGLELLSGMGQAYAH